MAIYHCSIKIISRGKGKSAVAAAAYRAAEAITNEYDGIVHNYTRKGGVVHTEILLPQYAPIEYLDRSTLWNAVELIEKNRNARLARSFYYSLPRGLDIVTYISMAEVYARDNFVARGMCADMFIHDKGDGNPHVHTLVTTRPLGERGQWLNKERAVYRMNPDGTKARDPQTGRLVRTGTLALTDWDLSENVEKWRRGWAETCNRELEREGLEQVTHRSYARQGLDIIPTKHKGHKVIELERRGIMTDRALENRDIDERNRQRKERALRELEREYDIERSR